MAILGLALLLPCAQAQTKGERSLYGKTLKKLSVKTADKFLKKYPESVYAQEILHLKDSLLLLEFNEKNTSLIPRETALQASGDCLDAIGWKKDGREHILALNADLTLRILSPEGVPEDVRSIPVYTLQESPGAISLAKPLEVVAPLGRRNYLHFAYMNGDSEYVEVLYLPEEDILNQAMFYGNPIKGEQLRIEGQSPESIEGLDLSPEVSWLCGKLKENPSLVTISRADLLTDTSIRWWMDKNPKAATTASRLNFGGLDPESSIVSAYKKARKEKGRRCNAALFDIRGYTVICTINKSTGDYSLVWCEPVCKNRNRDKFLNSIYFENDGTTLVLFYYKGRTSFKLRISTSSQSIRR